MKKRKFLLGLSVLLLTILAGCGADSELTDVSQDIQTEINKDYSSELSEMNIMDIISVESDEENNYQHSFRVLFISWLPKRTCRSYLLMSILL